MNAMAFLWKTLTDYSERCCEASKIVGGLTGERSPKNHNSLTKTGNTGDCLSLIDTRIDCFEGGWDKFNFFKISSDGGGRGNRGGVYLTTYFVAVFDCVDG